MQQEEMSAWWGERNMVISLMGEGYNPETFWLSVALFLLSWALYIVVRRKD